MLAAHKMWLHGLKTGTSVQMLLYHGVNGPEQVQQVLLVL
jgi:hypothetical protein